MNKVQKCQRFVLVLGFFLALSFLVVACSGSSAPPVESEAEAEYQVMLPAVNNHKDPIAGPAYPQPESESQVGEASVSNEAYPLSNEPIEAPAPIQRTELSATNPATVSLSSGNIQLVEFFAYW